MRYPHGFLGALATVIVVALPAPALASESPVQHTETYLVEHDGTDAVGALEALEAVGATPEETYTRALDGFAVELTDAQARWLSYDDDVTSLTAVPRMRIGETGPDPITTATSGTSETTVQFSPTWGLDQLDQAAHTSDGSYSYPTSAGSGVKGLFSREVGALGRPRMGGSLFPPALHKACRREAPGEWSGCEWVQTMARRSPPAARHSRSRCSGIRNTLPP